MHKKPETLGCIIKTARENAGITIEALANRERGQKAKFRCPT